MLGLAGVVFLLPDVEYNVMALAYMIEVDSDTIVAGALQVYN